MAYREQAAPIDEPRIVRYGPFRLRKLEAAFGVAGVVVVVVAAALWGTETLECERGPRGAICTHVWAGQLLPDRTTRFDPDTDVVEVRFVPYEGSKRTERGKTELIDAVGRALTLFEDDREDARETYEALAPFFRDRSRTELRISAEPPWPAIVFLLALGGFALFISARALAQVTSIRLTVWRQSGRLRVTRRWLGIPIGARELSLDDVDDVRVERGGIRSFTQRGAQPEIPAGRIILVTPRGETPLSEKMLAGAEPHERAADALRAELDLRRKQREPAVAEAVPAPAAEKPPSTLRRTLLFFGGVIAVGIVLQAALMLHADRTQGWLEVECAHRCRMGGMECLPGGSWSSSFDPGNVTIELWDPSSSEAIDGWRRIVLPIRLGHTTRYECRPGAEPVIE